MGNPKPKLSPVNNQVCLVFIKNKFDNSLEEPPQKSQTIFSPPNDDDPICLNKSRKVLSSDDPLGPHNPITMIQFQTSFKPNSKNLTDPRKIPINPLSPTLIL